MLKALYDNFIYFRYTYTLTVIAMQKKKKPTLWFEEPVDEMMNMQKDFLKNIQGMIKIPFMPARPMIKPLELQTGFIPVKMAETDDELIVRAELPGVSKEEVKLKVTPTTVDISATRRKESMDKGQNFFKRESSFGSMRRIVSLPAEVKTEGVKAKMENGILQIALPKKEAKKKDEKSVRIE